MAKVDGFVEVLLTNEGNFLKIKETLTRIGIASKKDKTLYQSCHILHKQGKYYIVHFKELFRLDGKLNDIDENDIGRRNTICKLLQEWGLIKIVDSTKTEDPLTPLNQIKVIAYKDKSEWQLIPKYFIGKR